MAKEIKQSSIINQIQWGSIQVDGIDKSFKDIIIYPGDVENWDWRKSDTHHQPGILPKEVHYLISKGCDIIILSSGMENMLHVSDETLKYLEEQQMKINENYFILQSEEAVQKYNYFVKNKRQVGALIHSTC